MQNVLDKTRTLLDSYDVPAQWWVEALQNAIWNINRYPTSNHDNKSPLEQAFGIVPNADEMIPFFCPGMYQVTKDEREPNSVLKWKARACRFLGHDKNSNTFTVWDIESRKRVEVRSDVIWNTTLVE
jgi:hypothetical protein